MNRLKQYGNLLLVVILSAVISGCAVKADRINLTSDLPDLSIKCPDAGQTSIGIAPVIDERPDIEKKGDKAHGLYLLLWNQRKGSYISSDESLGGNVSGQVANLIQTYLKKSNCFRNSSLISTILPKQPGVEHLLVVFAKEKVRYVLVTRIKHLYGEQSQDAHFVLVPAYFVNAASWGNQVFGAIGQTEILFTIYDTQTGQEVWRENILETTESATEGAYIQVAKDALIKNLETFTKRLEPYVANNLKAKS